MPGPGDNGILPPMQQDIYWHHWHEALAALARDPGDGMTPARLIRMLSALVPFDAALCLVYRPDARPTVLYSDLEKDWRDNTMDAYLAGAYLLDPVFLLLREKALSGFIRLRDIAPANFMRSAYYLNYYRASNVSDEINLLIPQPDGSSMALALERARGKRPFAASELARLYAARPMLELFLEQCASGSAAARPDARHKRLHADLQQALERFGSSLLTRRQREILQLLLRGHSTESIAIRLKIAPGTVKVHRKHIYVKLDVKSQAELFPLFLGALEHADARADDDPLQNFLARPQRA